MHRSFVVLVPTRCMRQADLPYSVRCRSECLDLSLATALLCYGVPEPAQEQPAGEQENLSEIIYFRLALPFPSIFHRSAFLQRISYTTSRRLFPRSPKQIVVTDPLIIPNFRNDVVTALRWRALASKPRRQRHPQLLNARPRPIMRARCSGTITSLPLRH